MKGGVFLLNAMLSEPLTGDEKFSSLCKHLSVCLRY